MVSEVLIIRLWNKAETTACSAKSKVKVIVLGFRLQVNDIMVLDTRHTNLSLKSDSFILIHCRVNGKVCIRHFLKSLNYTLNIHEIHNKY